MPRDVARVAAATLQVGVGVCAVFLCALAAVFVVDLSGVGADRGLVIGVAFLLGLSMFAMWVASRTRGRWLRVLGVVAAVLAVVMASATVVQVWPAGAHPHEGLWTGVWMAALDAGLWLVILVATIAELGRLPRPGDATSPGWARAAAIGAPLALVALVAVVVGSMGSSWMIRFNSLSSDTTAAAQGRASTLSGAVAWSSDLTAAAGAVPTTSGLAVPVPSDSSGSAGVLMLDPGTGTTVWRYQLRGVDDPPTLATTADGSAVVVSLDKAHLGDDIPHPTFTLDAETGRIQAFWPDAGEVQDTDPPVLFDHVAQGTNSVIAISPAGKKLWTYRPERCADPRSARSTPVVMIVRARQCGQRELQVLGLDALTGERRWAQPAISEEGDSGPDTVVVRAGYQLELTSDGLRSRDLDTGAISWTASTPQPCSGRHYLVSAAATVFVAQCDDKTVNEPTSLTAYALASGEQVWRRPAVQPINALAAVDDRGVLAVTQGATTCDVQLLQATGSTTLLALPGGPSASAGVRCSDSRVLRVGDSYVLQLGLSPDRTRGGAFNRSRYRFIGLA